jgi:hypothetical protein
VGEQGAETGRLRLALEPGGKQLLRDFVVDSSCLECLSYRLAAKLDKLPECRLLGSRGFAEVAFTRKLGIAQPGGRSEERFHL